MIVVNESVCLKCNSEVEDVRVNLDNIYLGVVITNPVTSYSTRTDTIAEGFVVTTLHSKVIQTLIIVDPESNIPGLIILPTIVRNVESITLESGSHSWRVVLTL